MIITSGIKLCLSKNSSLDVLSAVGVWCRLSRNIVLVTKASLP